MARKPTDKPRQQHPNSLANLKPPWKPGEGGPGRPKLTEVEKAAREAARREIAEYFDFLKSLTTKQLESVVKDKEAPVVVGWYAKAILKGRKNGDMSELHRYHDRILGRSKQAIEHSQPLSPQEQEMLERMTDAQLIRVANGEDIATVFNDQ